MAFNTADSRRAFLRQYYEGQQQLEEEKYQRQRDILEGTLSEKEALVEKKKNLLQLKTNTKREYLVPEHESWDNKWARFQEENKEALAEIEAEAAYKPTKIAFMDKSMTSSNRARIVPEGALNPEEGVSVEFEENGLPGRTFSPWPVKPSEASPQSPEQTMQHRAQMQKARGRYGALHNLPHDLISDEDIYAQGAKTQSFIDNYLNNKGALTGEQLGTKEDGTLIFHDPELMDQINTPEYNMGWMDPENSSRRAAKAKQDKQAFVEWEAQQDEGYITNRELDTFHGGVNNVVNTAASFAANVAASGYRLLTDVNKSRIYSDDITDKDWEAFSSLDRKVESLTEGKSVDTTPEEDALMSPVTVEADGLSRTYNPKYERMKRIRQHEESANDFQEFITAVDSRVNTTRMAGMEAVSAQGVEITRRTWERGKSRFAKGDISGGLKDVMNTVLSYGGTIADAATTDPQAFIELTAQSLVQAGIMSNPIGFAALAAHNYYTNRELFIQKNGREPNTLEDLKMASASVLQVGVERLGAKISGATELATGKIAPKVLGATSGKARIAKAALKPAAGVVAESATEVAQSAIGDIGRGEDIDLKQGLIEGAMAGGPGAAFGTVSGIAQYAQDTVASPSYNESAIEAIKNRKKDPVAALAAVAKYKDEGKLEPVQEEVYYKDLETVYDQVKKKGDLSLEEQTLFDTVSRTLDARKEKVKKAEEYRKKVKNTNKDFKAANRTRGAAERVEALNRREWVLEDKKILGKVGQYEKAVDKLEGEIEITTNAEQKQRLTDIRNEANAKIDSLYGIIDSPKAKSRIEARQLAQKKKALPTYGKEVKEAKNHSERLKSMFNVVPQEAAKDAHIENLYAQLQRVKGENKGETTALPQEQQVKIVEDYQALQFKRASEMTIVGKRVRDEVTALAQNRDAEDAPQKLNKIVSDLRTLGSRVVALPDEVEQKTAIRKNIADTVTQLFVADSVTAVDTLANLPEESLDKGTLVARLLPVAEGLQEATAVDIKQLQQDLKDAVTKEDKADIQAEIDSAQQGAKMDAQNVAVLKKLANIAARSEEKVTPLQTIRRKMDNKEKLSQNELNTLAEQVVFQSEPTAAERQVGEYVDEKGNIQTLTEAAQEYEQLTMEEAEAVGAMPEGSAKLEKAADESIAKKVRDEKKDIATVQEEIFSNRTVVARGYKHSGVRQYINAIKAALDKGDLREAEGQLGQYQHFYEVMQKKQQALQAAANAENPSDEITIQIYADKDPWVVFTRRDADNDAYKGAMNKTLRAIGYEMPVHVDQLNKLSSLIHGKQATQATVSELDNNPVAAVGIQAAFTKNENGGKSTDISPEAAEKGKALFGWYSFAQSQTKGKENEGQMTLSDLQYAEKRFGELNPSTLSMASIRTMMLSALNISNNYDELVEYLKNSKNPLKLDLPGNKKKKNTTTSPPPPPPSGQGRKKQRGKNTVVDIDPDAPFALNEGQKKAFENAMRFVKSKTQKTFSIIGSAGTGKTTLVNSIIDQIQKDNPKVEIVLSSPTHRANSVIESKNPTRKVDTLHSLLGLRPIVDLESFTNNDLKFAQDDDLEPKIPTNGILIIDESSMINDTLYKLIMQVAGVNNTKIIFMGDMAQLGPVKQKTDSKALIGTEETVELTQVMRAKNSELLDESVYVREAGDFSYEIDMDKDGNGIQFINDKEAFYDRAVEFFRSDAFKKNPLLVRVLAYTNDAVAVLNKEIRKRLYGPEVPPIVKGETLMAYDTKAGIKNGLDYQVTKIIGRSTNTIYGVPVNTIKLTVEGVISGKSTNIEIVDPYTDQETKNRLEVEGQKIKDRYLDTREGRIWKDFKAETEEILLPFQIGEKGKVAKKAIDYGYAHTIHKSQGGTYENIMISGNNIERTSNTIDRSRLRYVAVTRAEKGAYVFTSKPITEQESVKQTTTESEPEAEEVRLQDMNIKTSEEKIAFGERFLKEITEDVITALWETKGDRNALNTARDKIAEKLDNNGVPHANTLKAVINRLRAIDYGKAEEAPNTVNEETENDVNEETENNVQGYDISDLYPDSDSDEWSPSAVDLKQELRNAIDNEIESSAEPIPGKGEELFNRYKEVLIPAIVQHLKTFPVDARNPEAIAEVIYDSVDDTDISERTERPRIYDAIAAAYLDAEPSRPANNPSPDTDTNTDTDTDTELFTDEYFRENYHGSEPVSKEQQNLNAAIEIIKKYIATGNYDKTSLPFSLDLKAELLELGLRLTQDNKIVPLSHTQSKENDIITKHEEKLSETNKSIEDTTMAEKIRQLVTRNNKKLEQAREEDPSTWELLQGMDKQLLTLQQNLEQLLQGRNQAKAHYESRLAELSKKEQTEDVLEQIEVNQAELAKSEARREQYKTQHNILKHHRDLLKEARDSKTLSKQTKLQREKDATKAYWGARRVMSGLLASEVYMTIGGKRVSVAHMNNGGASPLRSAMIGLARTAYLRPNVRARRDDILKELISNPPASEDTAGMEAAIKRISDFQVEHGFPTTEESLLTGRVNVSKSGWNKDEPIPAIKDDFQNLTSIFRQASNNPDSIVAGNPGLLTAYGNESSRAKIDHVYGIPPESREYMAALAEFAGRLRNFQFKTRKTIDSYWGKNNENKGKLTKNAFYNDLTLLMRDEDNGISFNLTEAMATTLFNYLGTRSKDLLHNDDTSIANLLGFEDKGMVNDYHRGKYGSGGISRALLAPQLGRAIRKQMNLQDNGSLDSTALYRLDGSLGLHAIDAGIAMGFFKDGYVTRKEFLEDGGSEAMYTQEKDSDTLLHYITLANARYSTENMEYEFSKEFNDILAATKNQEDFMDSFLGEDNHERYPSTKPIGEKQLQEFANKTTAELSPEMREGALATMNTKWTPNRSSFQMIANMPKRDILEMFGYVFDTSRVHKSQLESVLGRNKQILREYDNMMQFIARVSRDPDKPNYESPMYFPVNIWKQFRQGIGSNMITPQGSKMHRFFFGVEKWKEPIEKGSMDFIGWKLAVAQHLGIKIDKQSIETSMQEFHDTVMDRKGNINERYRPAVEALIKGENEILSEEEHTAIKNAVLAIGENAAGYASLVALADYKKSSGNSFTSSIFLETDGVTNGIATTARQLPVSNNDRMHTLLERTGRILAHSQHTSFAEYIERPDTADSYEGIALAAGSLIEDRIAAGKASTKEEDKIFATRLQALKNFSFPLVEKDKTTGRYTATSAGRNWAKYPLMIINYGGGHLSVQKAMSGEMLEQIYEDNIDLAFKLNAAWSNDPQSKETTKLTKELRARIKNIHTVIYGFAPKRLPKDMETLIKEWREEPKKSTAWTINELEVEGDDTAEYRLAGFLMDTYGTALTEAIDSYLMPTVAATRTITAMSNMMAHVSRYHFDSEVKDFIDRTGMPLPRKSDFREIRIKLRDQGLTPGAKHATSNSSPNYYADNSEYVKEEDYDLSDQAGGSYRAYHGRGEGGQQFLASTPLGDKTAPPKYSDSSKGRVKIKVPSRNIGVLANGASVIAMDANTNSLTQSSYEGMNLFDAYGYGPKDVFSGTAQTNQNYADLNSNWNLYESVLQQFKNIMGHPNTPPFVFKEMFEKGGPAFGLPHPFRDEPIRTYDEFKWVVEHINERIKTNKAILENRSIGENQFSLPGTTVPLNGGQTTLDDINAAWNQQIKNPEKTAEEFGSTNRDIDFGETVKQIEITSNNIETIARTLAKEGSVQHSPAHEERIYSLVRDILKPALEGMENTIDLHLSEAKKGHNYGRYEAQSSRVRLAIAESAATLGSQMSTQEVLGHEMLHAILWQAIRSNPVFYRRLEKIFFAAREIVTVDDFMNTLDGSPLLVGDPAAEKAAAQERYDYIFNNGEEGIHEFASFGLTNPALMAKLDSAIFKEPKKPVNETIWQSLKRLWSELVDWIFNGDVAGITETTSMSQVLEMTVKNMIEVKSRREHWLMQRFALMDKADRAIANIMANYFVPVTAYANTQVDSVVSFAGGRNSVGGSAVNIIAFPVRVVGLFTPAGKKRAAEIYSEFNLRKEGVLHQTVRELQGPDAKDIPWHRRLLQLKAAIDTARNRISQGVARQVAEAFASRPSRQEWQALNNGLLKVDAVSLMNTHSLDDIQRLLTDADYRNQEIAKYQRLVGERNYYYQNQAKGLGFYIAKGIVGLKRQMTNAQNIAYMTDVGGESYIEDGTIPDVEKNIDILATLHGINFTQGRVRDAAAGVIRRELKRTDGGNGIQFMLDEHARQKKDALDKVFGGDKVHTMKGYTKESYSSMISTTIGEMKDKARLEKEGYIMKGKLPVDSADPKKPDQFLFVSNTGLQRQFQSGMMVLSNKKHKGQSTVDSLNDLGKNNVMDRAQEIDQYYYNKSEPYVQEQMNGLVKLKTTEGNKLPVVDASGRSSAFRYVMSESTKIALLGKRDYAHEVLGNMAGSTYEKYHADPANTKTLDMLKEEYDADYDTNPDDFIMIGPASEDPKHVELYRMLPKNARRHAYNLWDKGGNFYVRKELLNTVMGYRKGSFFNWVEEKTDITVPAMIKHNGMIAGAIWQEIVKVAKRKVVILTPLVLIGNAFSNFVLSMVSGMSAGYTAKYQTEGARYMLKYLDDQRKKEEFERWVQQDPKRRTKSNLSKLDILEKRMMHNPVYELIKEGMYQTYVEDVDTAVNSADNQIIQAISYGNLNQKVSSFLDSREQNGITDIALKGYDVLTLSQNTRIGALLTQATQMSDFVARYAMYKFLTEKKGMSKDDAIHRIDETFVNYEVNTSPLMQYLNDMGILMFTKFWFRIQRVNLLQMRENPARVVTQKAVDQTVYDMSDIHDSLFPINLGLSHFKSPADTLDKATELSMFNYLPSLL